MNKDNIEQLKKLGKLFNTANVVTSEQIQEVLKGVLQIMNSFKTGNETLNTETKKIVNDLYNKITTENNTNNTKLLNDNLTTKKDIGAQLDSKLAEMKSLMEEFLILKPTDGLDADEDAIVAKVLAKIKLPEYQATVLDSGVQIIDKINGEKVARIKASQIDGLPKFTREVIREVGAHAGAYETPIKDSTGKLLNKDASGAWIIPASGGGGGSVNTVASADGSITVVGTTDIDLAVVKAPKLSTARTIGGVSFDGTANITVASATGGFAVSGGALTLAGQNITGVGTIGTTGARVTKLWIDDITATNAINGSITGNAATVTTNANLTGPITSVGNATSVANDIALPGNPTTTTQAPADNSTRIATTAYVDNAILGQRFKEAVKYASIAALPSIVYANGASGVGATLTGVALAAISLDSSSPAVNDRVLIKNQASSFQNGIYIVTATGSGIAVFILTRATDFDQASDIQTGDSVFVVAGNTLSTTTWAYTGINSPTMGTTGITWAQTAGQGAFTAGNGITITGVSIAINTAVTVDLNTAQALTNKDLTSGTNTFPTLNQNTTGSAAKLTTARNINGVAFDGTGNITVTAAGSTLTGTSLASGIVTVGDLTAGSIGTGFVVKGVTMTLGSDASGDVYYRNSSGVLTRIAAGTQNTVFTMGASSVPSWATPASGAASADVQIFTSTGVNTWTKPANAKWVEVIVIGAGGGGGGGQGNATSNQRASGNGGGGGAVARMTFRASDLGATETATVGAGGSGGAGSTSGGTPGAGTDGGASTFGSWLYAGGGGKGRDGLTGASGGGGGLTTSAVSNVAGLPSSSSQTSMIGGFAGSGVNAPSNGFSTEWGGASGAGAGVGANSGSGGSSVFAGPGGGAGANMNNTNTVFNATAGGANLSYVAGGGGALGGNGASGTNGTDGSANTVGKQGLCGQGGGGGGAGTSSAGGNGGNGGLPAGGGGGGGAGTSAAGGNGGTGGNGIIKVITYF